MIQIIDSLIGQVAVEKSADISRIDMFLLKGRRDILDQGPVAAEEKHLLAGQEQYIFEMCFCRVVKGGQLLPLGLGQEIVIALHGKAQHPAV